MFNNFQVSLLLCPWRHIEAREHEFDIHQNPSKKLVKMNKRKHFQAPEAQRKRIRLFLLEKRESGEGEVKWGFTVIRIVDTISTTVKREKRMWGREESIFMLYILGEHYSHQKNSINLKVLFPPFFKKKLLLEYNSAVMET